MPLKAGKICLGFGALFFLKAIYNNEMISLFGPSAPYLKKI